MTFSDKNHNGMAISVSCNKCAKLRCVQTSGWNGMKYIMICRRPFEMARPKYSLCIFNGRPITAHSFSPRIRIEVGWLHIHQACLSFDYKKFSRARYKQLSSNSVWIEIRAISSFAYMHIDCAMQQMMRLIFRNWSECLWHSFALFRAMGNGKIKYKTTNEKQRQTKSNIATTTPERKRKNRRKKLPAIEVESILYLFAW